MNNIVLYQQPGVSTIYLGETQVGETQPTSPILVHGKNTSINNLRQIHIEVDNPNVQLASTDAGPWSDSVDFGSLTPDQEFGFFSRLIPPSQGEAHKQEFSYNLDYVVVP